MSGRIYQEPWQAQQIWLTTALKNANVAGGPLSTITAIDPVVPPISETDPVIGFQHRSARDEPIGQNRLRQINVFEFNLVVVRTFSATQTDVPEQTKIAAENLWNDGNGNGLGAVLRLDPTLGGLCTVSMIAPYQTVIGRGVLDENETSAVVVALLTTVTDDFPIF